VVAVSGDLGAGARDPGFDTFLKLLRRCRHVPKGSEMSALYFLKQ
jgi:hypothetical protein